MQLKSAHLYYGTSRYPITNITVDLVPFAPLCGQLLDEVCAQVALASGCLTMESVKGRVTHNVAITESVYDLPAGPLVIPATVQLLGNGFSVVWG